jgi:hypothetical protein
VVRDGGVLVTAGARDLAARRLLLGAIPVLSSGTLGAPTGDIVEHLIKTVMALDESVLPVQGPPGAGKTYAGAEAIYALVKAGKKVGVTANSHAVIRNLLDGVADCAGRHGDSVAIAHKCDEGDADAASRIREFNKPEEARRILDDGSAQVVGGTHWLWSRADLVGAVDVLFVDEAGQLALANVIAVSPCATSVVLLGDPQQLEQPKKAAHPDGVDVSALEYALGGLTTVPVDRGVFLPKTWRMCPSITAYASEMFYEGRLSSIEGLERQVLAGAGVGAFGGAGLRTVFVEHDGNRSYSNEEVSAVVEIVRGLTSGAVSWADDKDVPAVLRGEDILVVAPYNAQVSRLVRALEGTGARAGTVDKFQGQEAPVAIYSLASSSAEDAPRGMAFLYALDRLNVATSRARCATIVVSTEPVFTAACGRPDQMRMVNAFARYLEMGRGLGVSASS